MVNTVQAHSTTSSPMTCFTCFPICITRVQEFTFHSLFCQTVHIGVTFSYKSNRLQLH